MARYVSKANAAPYIAGLREFTGNSLQGRRVTPSSVTFGYLPKDHSDVLADRVRVGAVGYVVYSYGTPIAWHDDALNEWVIPDVKYSSTTSRHQNVVKGAVR